MADVKAIRDRLKSRLSAVSGLRTFDIVPDQLEPPAAFVAPAPGVFASDVTFDDEQDFLFVVTVLVAKVVDRVSQDALDVYLSGGAADIATAIDSGSTADWDYAVTAQARNYGEYVYGEGVAAQRYLGFEIPVMVAA